MVIDNHWLLEIYCNLLSYTRVFILGNKKPEHKELGRFLVEYCTMWQTIGLHLKLKQALLNVIAGDHHSSQERFKETLHRWLQMDTEATWTTLELAITNANREKLSLGPLDASKEFMHA